MTLLKHTTDFRPRLFFIVGPTAVGKTELSLRSAECLQAEILSCDSLCVYQGMDIGTAKPTRTEQTRIPHHGIDLVPVSEQFSVEAYQRYARRVVEACARKGRNVIVSGGSGFYLKSFFAPVSDGIEIPAEIHDRVRRIELESGLAGLLDALQPFDRGEARLDRNNPRRVAKALERCLATGTRLSELQAAFARMSDPWQDYEKHLCLLERDPADLRLRIRRRIDQMMQQGLIEEVRTLLGKGITRNPSASGAIGYRETLAWLEAGARSDDLDALRQTIAIHTDQLVRKQRIWFRRQIPIQNRLAAEDAAPRNAFPHFGWE